MPGNNPKNKIKLGDTVFRRVALQGKVKYADLMDTTKPQLTRHHIYPVPEDGSISVNSSERLQEVLPYWPMPIQKSFFYESFWYDENIIEIEITQKLLAASTIEYTQSIPFKIPKNVLTWREHLMCAKTFSHVDIYGKSKYCPIPGTEIDLIIEIINNQGFIFLAD